MIYSTSFFDYKIQYRNPIRLPKQELNCNIFSKLTLNNNANWAIDIFDLPNFYHINLPEKKKTIEQFFSTNEIKLSDINIKMPFFNTTTDLQDFHGEIIFDIESILFKLIQFPKARDLKIHTNVLGINDNFMNSACVKIKIRPQKDELLKIANFLNQCSPTEKLPNLRFDGNRHFELFDLISFLKLLNQNVLDKIDYIEEPFKNFYDIYSFQKIYDLKIGVDESLIYFINDLNRLPLKTTLILKPALFGISKSFTIIETAAKLNRSTIISSTYQTSSTFYPLLALANFADSFQNTPNFHGLDTLNYLPVSELNDQLRKSLINN